MQDREYLFRRREYLFRRQLRQFRILTIVGYVLLLLIVVGIVIAPMVIESEGLSVPVALPVGIVGMVLAFSVAMPFLLGAYDKTKCPYCGKHIEEGYWISHGIRFNGPTRRYWKLFFGRPVQCPHCHSQVGGEKMCG